MTMKYGLRWLFAAALICTAALAHATYHTLQIDEVYSNADGTVQYVVLREAAGADGQQLLRGHSFSSTHAGVTKTYTFPNDLPSAATASKRVLIASEGFAALGLIVPDYVLPNQFLATDGAVRSTVFVGLPGLHLDEHKRLPVPAD